ncbi:MAG TPA: bifunctional phosphoglucose/phosphomannose isomerase [Candidatus Saccharimonadales bacterium]|nr:bifunctional phosphoglucose/phosphomannose isomerase [Candidatus Saccharimonadales bacterium]
MLDDQSFLSRYDNGNALGVVGGQPGQLSQQFSIPDIDLDAVTSVVLAGMGGSALAGQFLQHYLSDQLKLPMIIDRGYELPQFVGADTLVIVSSYSGNTEEELAELEQARGAGAKIVIMTSGGELKRRALATKLPLIIIPSGLQPRLAVLYEIKALASLFDQTGLSQNVATELEETGRWLLSHSSNWVADVQTPKNIAKQIAQDLLGCGVVVYGGPTLSMQAYKWKIDINENAKQAAFYNELPEFNHNEFLGWKNPRDKLLKVVELQSSLDLPQIAKRWEVSNRLLSGQMPKPIIVEAIGKTKLQQMLWTQLLGDYVSLYLAFLNGIDPTPVDMIEKLKRELKKS